LQRTFRKGLLFAMNYTWSHEIDDGSMGSGDGDSLTPEIVACRACDNASGIWDVRHVVNANAVYELPFGAGKTYLNQPGILQSVFGSWALTTVVGAHRGFPVNVTVDRSASAVPDANTNNQHPNVLLGVPRIPPLAVRPPRSGSTRRPLRRPPQARSEMRHAMWPEPQACGKLMWA
jgi:hypothetical protein